MKRYINVTNAKVNKKRVLSKFANNNLNRIISFA